MQLLSINTTEHPLAKLPERELPFYRPTWDPFNVEKEWERIRSDPDFSDALKEIIDFNMLAVQQGHFDPA